LISVTVHTILDIKKVVGKREVQIALPRRSTVADLLEEMVKSWGEELSSLLFEPDSHEVLSHIQIMVNGRAIAFLNGIRTELADGDEVLILPPVAGG
jgi:sulfur-carrier protein